MTPAARREYACAIHQRYAQASRTTKRQILTEFCATTGYHRKYAIALLNGAPPLAPRVRRRSPIYRPHTVAILAAIWEAAEGRGSKKDIQGWVAQIKKEIETTTSDCDKEKLQERLAKLAGGVAQTKVGAATETELKEKKHRFEDALSTSKAAVEEGIFPGGGVALLNISKALGQGGRRC